MTSQMMSRIEYLMVLVLHSNFM